MQKMGILRKNQKNKAFTLAEILITLGIIGVVCAMTIPILISNYQKSTYFASLQKNYSVLSQTTNQIIQENGGNAASFFGSTHLVAERAYAEKLQILKNCENTIGCWHTGNIKYLNGTDSSYHPYDDTGNFSKFTLNDGTNIALGQYGSGCNTSRGDGPLQKVCTYVIVDVNGIKPPNIFGRDAFMFWVTPSGLYPFGCGFDTSVFNPCAGTNSQGCAGKVLSEGAINY